MLWQLCSGADAWRHIHGHRYTTSPVNNKAQIVFGIGCGAITVFIRYFGAYVEGVSYAILLMNTTVWLLIRPLFPAARRYKEKRLLTRLTDKLKAKEADAK